MSTRHVFEFGLLSVLFGGFLYVGELYYTTQLVGYWIMLVGFLAGVTGLVLDTKNAD